MLSKSPACNVKEAILLSLIHLPTHLHLFSEYLPNAYCMHQELEPSVGGEGRQWAKLNWRNHRRPTGEAG